MTIELEGITLEVAYDYQPQHRGSRDRYGVPLEPDEPEEVEVIAVMVGEVDILPLLGERMIEVIGLEVLEQLRERRYDEAI